MEHYFQRSPILDELIMAPKIDTPFPEELFQNTWNLDQTQDLHSLPTNQFIPCPCEDDDYNNYYLPFLDSLTSPELNGSFYDDFPPPPPPRMSKVHQDVENGEFMFLENCINSFQGQIMSSSSSAQHDHTPINMDIIANYNNNVGTSFVEGKSASKKPNGQPSKNLMAERRRRKRLNDRLAMLRSIVPKISKMDRTSILGDTIDYIKELVGKIQKIREEEHRTESDYLKEIKSKDFNHVRNHPKFDVQRTNKDTKVEVCCAARPGLLLSTLSTLDVFGLDAQQCVISCFNDFSMQASCFEVGEHRSLASPEDVKLALFRNAGYGGRCL